MARYQFIVSGTPSDLVANAFPELVVAPVSDLGGACPCTASAATRPRSGPSWPVSTISV
jgi:hypothetical protein